MTYLDHLRQHAAGLKLVIDRRAAGDPDAVPDAFPAEVSGTTAGAATDLARLARSASAPAAYITRGGTIFVLRFYGTGKLIYEGTKGAPSALQRRAIAAFEAARRAHAGLAPEPVTDELTELEPAAEPAEAE